MAESKMEMRGDAIKRLKDVLENPPLGSLCSEDIVAVLVGDGWYDSSFEDDVKTIIDLLTDDVPSEEYTRLPLDMDGKPIHIGDVMENTFGSEHFTVLAIGNDGCEDVLFCEDDDLNYQCYSAMACVHHKELTVRDTVEELVSEAYTCGWIDGSDDTFSFDTKEMVERYTKRLEEA